MENSARMQENAAVSRAAAAGSMVLLKNVGGALPLVGEAGAPLPVALFGIGQIYTVKGGTGSGSVNNLRTASVLDGFCACRGLEPDPLLARKYRVWAESHPNVCVEKFMTLEHNANPEMPLDGIDLNLLAGTCAAAVVVLSRVAGEGADMVCGPGTLQLTDGETRLLEAVAAAFSRTVLVLNTPGYLEITDVVPKVQAVVFMGFAGQEGGHALCDVLTGAAAPSGRLTDTWPLRYTDCPCAETFGGGTPNGNRATTMGQTREQLDVPYSEDIFVGYRYYDTFQKDVLYPFGFGLDYGAPMLGACSMGYESGIVSVTAEIENRSETYPCREVVQVYATVPDGALEQPLTRLITFDKTGLLAPGGKETVRLSFPATELSSYSDIDAAYVMEPGFYFIRVGGNCRSTCVAGALELRRCVVAQQLTNRLGCPPEGFETLRKNGAKPFTYPGEISELSFARAHAIRLPERELKSRTVKYRAPRPALRPGRKGLRLRDAAAGTASLMEFTASLPSSALCRLVMGVGMDLTGMPPMPEMAAGATPPGDFSVMEGVMRVPGAAGQTADLSEEFGIPPLALCDGPAGIRIKQKLTDEDGNVTGMQLCTAFPAGSLLACSWDRALLEGIGRAVGREMLEYGVDLWLAPGMNLHRSPLGGRNFEYFAEDPVLTGVCASAITQGVQAMGCGVTLKHFAGNSQETQRDSSNDLVTERAFRELYLLGFEIAVRQAKPWALMTAYNDVNGVPCAENYDLCTAVARDEWGFDGLIMTDWGGGLSEPVLALHAGNDMMQPGGPREIAALEAHLAAEDAVHSRGLNRSTQTLTRAALEQAALHILGIVLRAPAMRAEK